LVTRQSLPVAAKPLHSLTPNCQSGIVGMQQTMADQTWVAQELEIRDIPTNFQPMKSPKDR
jgi:hypothetical protein